MADAPFPDARAWMTKAWRDLETARRVVGGDPPLFDVAVYHCQQAAEKAIKAFLVHHDQPVQKTHDIEVLADLATEIEPSFSELMDAADSLTPYASRFRYPNATFAVEPSEEEFNTALQQAGEVFEFVRKQLPPETAPPGQ